MLASLGDTHTLADGYVDLKYRVLHDVSFGEIETLSVVSPLC